MARSIQGQGRRGQVIALAGEVGERGAIGFAIDLARIWLRSGWEVGLVDLDARALLTRSLLSSHTLADSESPGQPVLLAPGVSLWPWRDAFVGDPAMTMVDQSSSAVYVAERSIWVLPRGPLGPMCEALSSLPSVLVAVLAPCHDEGVATTAATVNAVSEAGLPAVVVPVAQRRSAEARRCETQLRAQYGTVVTAKSLNPRALDSVEPLSWNLKSEASGRMQDAVNMRSVAVALQRAFR